jgi:hypothetical protein
MEENNNESTNETENANETVSEGGLLVDAARAIGSTIGKVASAIGVGETGEAEPAKRRRQEKVGLVTSARFATRSTKDIYVAGRNSWRTTSLARAWAIRCAL